MMRFLAPSQRFMLVALFVLIVVACSVRCAHAGEVSVEIQSRDVYVNVPFALTFSIKDAQEYTPITLPRVDGLSQVGEPRRSEQSLVNIINGRRTDSRTIQYTYVLVATRTGSITIPQFVMTVDGVDRPIRPIVLTVSDSSDHSLLRAQISAARETIYLGEPVDVVLTVWIKQYTDEQLNVRLGAEDLWSLIDFNRSAWGSFLDAMRHNNGRAVQRLAGEPVTLTDASGDPAEFFEYTVRAQVWPEVAGALPLEPTAVLMRYPVELERSRDFFSRGQLTVASARPVVAPADMPAFTVLPLPEEGQPEVFTGAVGRFGISIAAAPSEVMVGEPITLTMTVTDRSPRATRLEHLQATPLDRVAALADAFNVPADTLAGIVAGRTKTFTQSIRARRDDVAEIPPIPFVFFNPTRQEYVTVMSDPIPLTVLPAATVGVADVIGAEPANGGDALELTELSGGLRANAIGSEVLTFDPPFRPHIAHLGIVSAPPCVWLALLVVRWRRRRHQDVHHMRRRNAAKRAAQRLTQAIRMEPVEQASTTSKALADYIADRCGLPDGALTPREAVRRLTERSANETLVHTLERLFQECDQARFTGPADAAAEPIADRARHTVRALERERLG